jgi:hypothetical protein
MAAAGRFFGPPSANCGWPVHFSSEDEYWFETSINSEAKTIRVSGRSEQE